MGWSYRKSIGVAPLKINFSKKGISYSIGMKGARINMGPNGTYVNLSAGGISYRQKILQPATPAQQTISPIPSNELVNEISSANVALLTDTDSKAFVEELNKKYRQASYAKWGGIIPFSIILLMLMFFSFRLSEEQWYLTNTYLGYELFLCFACFVPLIYWLKKLDKKRFRMELHYDMDDKYQEVYQQFRNHFATFTQSSMVWQYLNSQHTTDYKRNAGAGKLIKRIRVRGVSENKIPIPYFITNVAIPCISLSNIDLFFLPERLLIKRDDTFAAVFYKHLHIGCFVTKFVESDMLPADAKVIDYTWLYVNKSGGPDKRFNGNRKIPICAYSEYMFTSDTGILEVISTSRLSAMDAFAGFLSKIGELQTRMEKWDK